MIDPILLDLLNSRLIYGDGPKDELADDTAAAKWLIARGAKGTSDEIADAREARGALVGFIRGNSNEAVLEPWISAMRKVPSVTGNGLVWNTVAPKERAIGARALEEWSSLQTDSGSRIRPCAAEDCQHFFIDMSKANSRKWHSMETCGNRQKSRRHYARSKTLAD